jgi:peptidoglycan/LPS O-acetylase OafA/YrhL
VTSARHWPDLDGLRGIAILLVIPHNADRFAPVHDWTRLAAIGAHLGWIGVQLFFVLSGFLITRKLLDSRDSPRYYSAFYGRRALRILPLYVATLVFLLYLLPQLVTLPAPVIATYQHQIWLWTFLNNWVQSSGRTVYWFPHFWSLAVEEQFYLVWPLVLAWVSPRRLVPACLGIALVAIAARSVLLACGAPITAIYEFTVCRMDALAIGAIAAVAMGSPQCMDWLQQHATALLTAALGLTVITAAATRGFDITDSTLVVAGFTLLALAFAAILVIAAAAGPDPRVGWLRGLLVWPPLRSVGRYSYAMYIFHVPIALAWSESLLGVLSPLGSSRPVVFAIAVALASYAAGFASYHLLEKHALALKRYFEP